jgi:hypothetical protein
MTQVWVNDVDLGTYGFVLGALDGHADAPNLTYPSGSVLGLAGGIPFGTIPTAAPRVVTLGGHVLSADDATARAAVDSIKALTSGLVRLRFADRTTQEYRGGRLLGLVAAPRAALLSNRAFDLTLAVQFLDPLRYTITPTTVTLSSTPAACALGTALTFPVVTVTGACTNPTITLKTSTGTTVGSLSITGSVGAGESLVIDCGAALVSLVAGGVSTPKLDWWTGGDFFALDPADGVYATSAWPTLAITTASGTPAGSVTYSQRWL